MNSQKAYSNLKSFNQTIRILKKQRKKLLKKIKKHERKLKKNQEKQAKDILNEQFPQGENTYPSSPIYVPDLPQQSLTQNESASVAEYLLEDYSERIIKWIHEDYEAKNDNVLNLFWEEYLEAHLPSSMKEGTSKNRVINLD